MNRKAKLSGKLQQCFARSKWVNEADTPCAGMGQHITQGTLQVSQKGSTDSVVGRAAHLSC